ncbi:subtilisin-like protease SBT5.4 [Nicotiana sylvestris]|uniref:Subtilisin-like protease SBT5.4 n=2 Tax=Nicotiana TaxID=4085 RepID=A0A1S4AVJ2_TOBAC|nr:PREDICTED: subtilisin-like protease SBT5.4 [Nicotiana sylvestris]XP_016480621.1 PREDICTED: subtilisin-like protease SBT5.4 [Nicotiana tabacum]
MSSPKISILFLFLILFSLRTTTASATKKSYVVYMGSHSHGSALTRAILQRVSDFHINFLAAFLGGKDKAKESIFYSYRRRINGFAADLEEKFVALIQLHPKVISVFPNERRELHTFHSWDFLSLEDNGVVTSGSLWEKAKFGQDIIIGNLDTGVWPENPSFNDEGYGPIPSRWKGECQNDDKVPFSCNRKLIGARYFHKGYDDLRGNNNTSNIPNSPRDTEGHGTHTLSTAAGNFAPKASVIGVYNGTAKGGAPKARVAAYKVCWPAKQGGGCFDADILKAFDFAIDDGVDVISASVGGKPRPYFRDAAAIGAFHAMKEGIVVVTSAGNSGPMLSTVGNIAPWMITVGASTIDREFESNVKLQNGLTIKGTSISYPLPEEKFYPLINGEQAKTANATVGDAKLCKQATLDASKVKGRILVCLRGNNTRVDKGHQAVMGGAVGMILCNDQTSGNDIIADVHLLPASHITYNDGLAVFAYINSTNNAMGSITAPKATLGIKPAPTMASFSSRGPNLITPAILKPDITAPGVNIIAAYTEGNNPSNEVFDNRRTAYNVMSGTSMSCPHVSGIVGLLKAIHPDWSPAAIRSALMTTASPIDNTGKPLLDTTKEAATPFACGAGPIRPNLASDPGLIYDLEVDDYLNFLCASGYDSQVIRTFNKAPYICPPLSNSSLLEFNYPSITVPALSGNLIVTRTLTNVGPPGTFTARVGQPPGISVVVEPNVLIFKSQGQKERFSLHIKAVNTTYLAGVDQHKYGELVWSDGTHTVRSPITVEIAR